MGKINKLAIVYDSDDDILEVVIGESSKEAISVEAEEEDEVFLRLDPDTRELVGMTILGFRRYLLDNQGRGRVSHEFKVENVVR
jgi:uncharacterized protein YuzE